MWKTDLGDHAQIVWFALAEVQYTTTQSTGGTMEEGKRARNVLPPPPLPRRPAGRRELPQDNLRAKTSTFEVPTDQNTTKIPREDPPERGKKTREDTRREKKRHEKIPRERKKNENGGGRRKRKREILAPPPFGAPPFRGPTLAGPHPCGAPPFRGPTLLGSHPSGP